MSMHYVDQPIRLQFELSSMCNALCLGCVRTDTDTFSHTKEIVESKKYISIEVFKKIIDAEEFASVTELEFCGTIDDPLMHPYFLEMLEYARRRKFKILIHTNASLRSKSYWIELANILQQHNDHIVRFSIDGLEDTNHLYRQNTTWSKIMENATAFIQAGGKAMWQFLIFPWNKHQVEHAHELSKDMGFCQFVSRHDRSIATEIGLEKIQKIKVENIRKHHAISSVTEITKELENKVANDIECDTKNRKMYFIGYDARLWPCCFLHNGFMKSDIGKVNHLKDRLFGAYESDSWNDLSMHTVGEILNHSFYTNDLTVSWTSQDHGTNKYSRITRCTEVCSKKQLKELPIGNYKKL